MGIIANQFSRNEVILRKPGKDDGLAIYQLIKQSPPLDLNSSYNYHLLSSHFADTCVVAEFNRELVGFLSAYLMPGDAETLFVWQVAVDQSMRGKQIARLMLSSLLSRPECRRARFLETTVNPSNTASRKLFEGYARDWGGHIEEGMFLDESSFEDDCHESEILLRIHLKQTEFQLKEKIYANI